MTLEEIIGSVKTSNAQFLVGSWDKTEITIKGFESFNDRRLFDDVIEHIKQHLKSVQDHTPIHKIREIEFDGIHYKILKDLSSLGNRRDAECIMITRS